MAVVTEYHLNPGLHRHTHLSELPVSTL